jgi:uncharacterized membrane-anchored protein
MAIGHAHLEGFRNMLIARLARVIAVALLVIVAASPPAKAAGGSGSKPVASASAAASAAPPASAEVAPEARLPWKQGPTKIDLGHELDLDLPEPYVFLGMPEAGRLMEKLGNLHNESLLGVVASKNDDAEWFVTVRYEEAGFIKDDEEIKGDELLQAISEGAEASNPERVQRGFKEIHADSWAEPPRYDKTVHHLVWALNVRDVDGVSVNFNTRILGRHGYASINLVTAPARLAGDKPVAAALLEATSFRAGARYQDFDSKKDKVAEYGLIGLVLGGAGLGAAKLVKVGLLAKFSKVIIAALIAGKKAVVAFFIGIGALFKRFFSRKPAKKPTDE